MPLGEVNKKKQLLLLTKQEARIGVAISARQLHHRDREQKQLLFFIHLAY